MAERRMGIIVFLFCLCLCLLPNQASAASTANATEQISPNQNCTLTVAYGYNGLVFKDVPVKLYKIADVSADFQYSLTSSFRSSDLVLNGVSSASEWNMIRTTLGAHIVANHIEATSSAVTDAEGKISVSSLKPGLYLAVPGQVIQNDAHYLFDSALIALPGLGTDGKWQYQVTVTAKAEVLPPITPDEETEFKILKLWKGDTGRADRPKRVEVEIFRNGISYQTVVLSAENQWSYSWKAPADNAQWLVVERNIPSGYSVTVEKKETSFVLTNVRHTDSPGNRPNWPGHAPKTGDTSHILLYTVLLYASGMILLLLGITRKRRRE